MRLSKVSNIHYQCRHYVDPKLNNIFFYQVVAECGSVAAYTVVATFSNGVFSPDSDDVGIFLECLPNNGFTVKILIRF